MGCDIHLVLERQVSSKWLGVSRFDPYHDHKGNFQSPIIRERNYERFALLANVRGEGPSPKGVPDDASDLAKHMIAGWAADGHSHSHFRVDEFIDIVLATEGLKLSDFARTHAAYFYLGIDEEADGPVTDYRIVFWFDN